MFTEGFEKEAGIKHWATAAMLAASPVKAKAGSNVMDALKTTGNAVRETQTGRQIASTADKYLKRAQSVHLWGKSEGAAAASGAAGKAAGSSASASPNLYLQDAKRLKLDYGRFSGSAEPGKMKGSVDLGKGFSIAGEANGGERRAGVMFKREF